MKLRLRGIRPPAAKTAAQAPTPGTTGIGRRRLASLLAAAGAAAVAQGAIPARPVAAELDTPDFLRATAWGGNVALLEADPNEGPILVAHTNNQNIATVTARAHKVHFGAAGFFIQFSDVTTAGAARAWTNRLAIGLTGNHGIGGT